MEGAGRRGQGKGRLLVEDHGVGTFDAIFANVAFVVGDIVED